jgi:hypothetical protein
VQKIISAKTLTVLIRNEEIICDDLFKVYSDRTDDLSDGNVDMCDPVHAIYRLAVCKLEDRRGKSVSVIEDHLNYFCMHTCADPRDKIFGSVGMFVDSSNRLFDVDYGKSTE